MIHDPRILAARLIAASPFAISIADAQAQTKERRRELLATPPLPEPDITPEPLPVVDAVGDYARDFWKDKESPAKPVRRTPRKKNDSSKQQCGPFRVITGGKGGDKDK